MPHQSIFEMVFTEGQSVVISMNGAMDFVKHNMTRHAIEKKINMKARFIISELLTNAVKHAGKAETFLSISVDGESITIKKTDNGNRFSPINLELLFNSSSEHKVLLSRDSFHCIYAIAESFSKIRFV